MAYSNEEVLEYLQGTFGPESILDVSEPFGLLSIEVPVSRLIAVVTGLKSHPQFQFTFMTDLCGMHFPEQKGRELGMVYMLHSWGSNTRIRIRTFVPIENPLVPTLEGIYKAANWMERETYDFFGIIFEGHPDLRRILNVDDMDYFPMRKEYPLEDQTRRDKVDEMFGR